MLKFYFIKPVWENFESCSVGRVFMVAFLERLESNGIIIPSPLDEQDKTWKFAERLQTCDIEFFRYFARNHLLVNLEYTVTCSKLLHDLAHLPLQDVTEEIAAVLMLSELLEYLYRHYINIPREAANAHNQQVYLRKLLAQRGYQFLKKEQEEGVSSFTKRARELNAQVNFYRLLLLRTRRLLISLKLIIESLLYHHLIEEMVEFTRVIVSHLSWIFFGPRLLINLFLLAKHTIPSHHWMSPEEMALGVHVRIRVQMERHWFELQNDFIWLNSGLANAFFLIGLLSPLALYLSAMVQGYDIIVASVRAHIELNRLSHIKAQYQNMMSKNPHADISGYLLFLDERIIYEKKRLHLPIINASFLFVAIVLTLTEFSFNPFLPILGASIAVLTTVLVYHQSKKIEKEKPMPKLSQLSFFSADFIANPEDMVLEHLPKM